MSVQGPEIVIPPVVDQANSVYIDEDYSEEGIISTQANVHTSTARTEANVYTSTASTEIITRTSTASLKVKN